MLARIATSLTDQTEIERIKTVTGYKAFGELDERFLRQLLDVGVTPFDPNTVQHYKQDLKAKYDKHKWFTVGMSWSFFPLYDYKQPVPMNVLSLAASIKESVPDCSLWVDALVRRSETYDPFLVVSEKCKYSLEWGRDEKQIKLYHVAVWDEPTFNDIALDE